MRPDDNSDDELRREALDNPNDSLTLKAYDENEQELASHTCRPKPVVDSPEFAECVREFLEELKPHLPPAALLAAAGMGMLSRALSWGLGLALALSLFVLPGCGSIEARAKHDAFVTAYTEANADGVVTQQEGEQLAALFAAYVEVAGSSVGAVNWQELVLALVGTAATTFLGVNVYRSNAPASMVKRKNLAPPKTS